MELIAVQPPGREDRIRETPLSSIAAMVTEAARSISRFANQPYCLFGHSMGALIAFETARQLRTDGYSSPTHLFVSARRAPHCPERSTPIHHLADAELLEELRRRWNGIPSAILREPELVKLLLPGLRADLTAIEQYIHNLGDRLDCPVSVFGGENDRGVGRDDLLAWQRHTSGSFRLRMIPGDHFYIRDHRQEVVRAIIEDLRPYLSSR